MRTISEHSGRDRLAPPRVSLRRGTAPSTSEHRQKTTIATIATTTASLAAAATLTAGAAQAATCACVAAHHHHAHHVRYLTPTRYHRDYVPEYRAHRIAYAPPRRVYVEPEFIPGPPPLPVEYIDGPGYRAVDAAYVGPDPDWRPAVRRHHRHAPICRRP